MKNLKLLRQQHNLSQKEIGAIFHASQNAISQWENGTRKPSYDVIQKIADYFNVSVDYLLGREQTSPEDELTKKIRILLAEAANKPSASVLAYQGQGREDAKPITREYLMELLNKTPSHSISLRNDNDNEIIELTKTEYEQLKGILTTLRNTKD